MSIWIVVGTVSMPLSPVAEALDGPTNALFLSSDLEPRDGHDCTELLGRADLGMQDALLVEVVDSPRTRLSSWTETTTGSQVRQLKLVGLEGFDVGDPSMDVADTISLESISSPDDFTGLGIEVSDFLSNRRDATPTTVCLHSLTSMLQYADLETVFQFTHTLTGQLSRSNATAHCHLNPDAVDEQAVHTLAPLFDVVVGVDEGDPHVVSQLAQTA